MSKKTGFVFSGAAARIAQEAALAQTLIEGLTPSGAKIRPDVVSGTSSGALVAVAVNAVLRTKDGKATRHSFTWEDFKEILYDLKDGKVFDTSALGVTLIIPNNIPLGFVLDNSPLRKLLVDFVVKRMGFSTMGDLYLPTYISAVELDTGRTVRFSSRNRETAQLSLVDILMASTAIPAVFPTQRIKTLDKKFIDGGVGRDDLPVLALVEEKCKELYLICPMKGSPGEGFFSPKRLKNPPKILENSLRAFQYFTDDMRINEIERASRIAGRAYLYTPRISKPYPLLSFDTQRDQYQETMEWAKTNDPIPIKKNTDIKKLIDPSD